MFNAKLKTTDEKLRTIKLIGDMDFGYTSRSIGVALTLVSRLYSTGCHLNTSNHTDLELEQLHQMNVTVLVGTVHVLYPIAVYFVVLSTTNSDNMKMPQAKSV